MSLDDEKIEDLKYFLTHLSTIQFSGTMMLTFSKGALTSVSKKDDLIPGKLREVARKARYVKVTKVSLEGSPEEINIQDGTGANS